ncbi:hypothetical protein Bbelb_274820 [Branchiostoma belcheri]|nr:hypothetical protein Bbelb_274820 [Branchiostoma belcheri]
MSWACALWSVQVTYLCTHTTHARLSVLAQEDLRPCFYVFRQRLVSRRNRVNRTTQTRQAETEAQFPQQLRTRYQDGDSMRWKTLLPLFFVFIAFLFFGAWIFKTLEETYHVPGVRIEHDLEAVIVAIARRVNSSVSEDEVLAYIEAARTGRFPMSQNGLQKHSTAWRQGMPMTCSEPFMLAEGVRVDKRLSCPVTPHLLTVASIVFPPRPTGVVVLTLHVFLKISQAFSGPPKGQEQQQTARTTTAYHMDYFDAWFFCITFITTIGYGFITPHTVGGKLFCIVYAFLGIPVTLIMLTAIGRKLGDTNRWVEKKVQKKLPNHPGRIRAVTLLIVVVTSVGIFFFVPAIIFTIVEQWNFLDSLYYCFITLSTVGFGDFVSSVHHESSSYFGFVLYKVILFLWIMVGLSIVAAVFDLIQEALRGLKTRVNRNMKDLSVDHFGHLVSRVHEEGGKGLGKITDITKSKMKKQRARTSISRKNKNPDEETASDGMPGSYVAQEW